MDFDSIIERFCAAAPDVDYWCVRLVQGRSQRLAVRQGVEEPVVNHYDLGAFVAVADRGGHGYAATPDVGPESLLAAAGRARDWAWRTANRSLLNTEHLARSDNRGSYASAVAQPWDAISLADKLDALRSACARMKISDSIVDWQASLSFRETHVGLASSAGARIDQLFSLANPALAAIANEGTNTRKRTYGGTHRVRQGGIEQLGLGNLGDRALGVAEEALELLRAPNCPSGMRDLLLMPTQMTLQIHESIGHPLELDRILGDERNYAGTSFVRPEMFGVYQYGSPLLNVSFDPTLTEQAASYAFDDEGSAAQRHYLIRNGVLLRGLGGACSQYRSGLPGVASSRASGWNRPPIDRMANLNIEPGESSMEDLISSVEDGILMDNNCSWSIDDSRNKFQFGCEYGRRIVDGTLREVVRDPNYRGISASFWRSLAKVGDRSTFRVLGTANCGKGEPNQLVGVGHASPACVFSSVDIFGGA